MVVLPDSGPAHLASAICLAVVLLGCTPREPAQAALFYSEICPSCEDYRRAEDLAARLLWVQRSGGDLETRSANVITPEAQEVMDRYIRDNGFPRTLQSLPILFIADRYLVGYAEIEAEISRLETEIPRRGLRRLLTGRPRTRR
jgi:hypothetical protein